MTLRLLGSGWIFFGRVARIALIVGTVRTGACELLEENYTAIAGIEHARRNDRFPLSNALFIDVFFSLETSCVKAAFHLHSRGLAGYFFGAPALESALGLGTYPMESTWAVTDSRRRFLSFRSRVLMHDVKITLFGKKRRSFSSKFFLVTNLWNAKLPPWTLSHRVKAL